MSHLTAWPMPDATSSASVAESDSLAADLASVPLSPTPMPGSSGPAGKDLSTAQGSDEYATPPSRGASARETAPPYTLWHPCPDLQVPLPH